jgi:hypothetical protein
LGIVISKSNTALGFPIDENTQQQFVKIVDKTKEIMKTKINLDTHYFFHSNLLKPIFESSSILTEFKYIITKYVTSQKDMKDCVKEIKDIMTSYNLYNRDMEWDTKDLAYNFYQQYDAAYNMCLGLSFGFRFFIYQGGLISDSRDFCAAHNNKVWYYKEAFRWGEWTPSKGEYPSGYEIKQKDINTVPPYLDYPAYDPLIDRGGFNCRHALGWIDEKMAYNMRPDLKNKNDYSENL